MENFHVFVESKAKQHNALKMRAMRAGIESLARKQNVQREDRSQNYIRERMLRTNKPN